MRFQKIQRYGGLAESLIVELADVEPVAEFLRGIGAEFLDFKFADLVGECLAGPDEVAIHLHGHSHFTDEADLELKMAMELNESGFKNEIYNVGCMYWDYAPVTLDEILSQTVRASAPKYETIELTIDSDLYEQAGEVFKRYGEKIALPDILSAAAERHPGQTAAFRERDPSGEEGYVLVLAPAPDPAAVRKVLGVYRDRFPRAHWPLRIESRDDLPRLANGKIDTPALKSSPGPVLWKQHL